MGKINFAILLLCLFSISINAETEISIKFKEKSETRGVNITLGDISEINTSDTSLLLKYKKIIIGYAPPPKISKVIQMSYIKMKLKQNDINPECISNISLNKVEVVSEYNEIKGEKIIESAKEYLYSQIINYENLNLVPPASLPPITVPYGEIEFSPTAKIPFFSQMEKFVCNGINVVVNIKMNGEIIRKIQVPFVLKPTIAKTAVKKPFIVKSGDRVKIVVNTPYLSVNTLGNVMESGMEGETVKVRNLESGKIIAGKIINSQTLMVEMRLE